MAGWLQAIVVIGLVGVLHVPLGRYVPMVFVLGLAGSLARQRPVAVTAGSLRTDGPMFVSLALGVALVLVFLTFLPALSLGPLADGLRQRGLSASARSQVVNAPPAREVLTEALRGRGDPSGQGVRSV
jgi:hypothetical protein